MNEIWFKPLFHPIAHARHGSTLHATFNANISVTIVRANRSECYCVLYISLQIDIDKFCINPPNVLSPLISLELYIILCLSSPVQSFAINFPLLPPPLLSNEYAKWNPSKAAERFCNAHTVPCLIRSSTSEHYPSTEIRRYHNRARLEREIMTNRLAPRIILPFTIVHIWRANRLTEKSGCRIAAVRCFVRHAEPKSSRAERSRADQTGAE